MAFSSIGKVQDRDGENLEVQWNQETGEVRIHKPRRFTTYESLPERAKNPEEALSRAFAYLNFQ